eukprot:516355_1
MLYFTLQSLSSLQQIQLPTNVNLNLRKFGLSGEVNFDFKLLELSIYLKFQICGEALFFTYCLADITLWSKTFTAYSKRIPLVSWGIGSETSETSETSRRRLQSSGDDLTTKIRIYWALQDDPDEYPYFWDKEDFFAFYNYDLWDSAIFNTANCGAFVPKSSRISQTIYHNSTHSIGGSIQDPSKIDYIDCEYNLYNFSKIFMTEIEIIWYDFLSKESCSNEIITRMFGADQCCDFAIQIYEFIKQTTGKSYLDISSYKMIITDMNGNSNNKQCVEYYLNTEVQIGKTPYYDDCSVTGWKIATSLNDEYELGAHSIFGDDKLRHDNNKKTTCLNYYNVDVDYPRTYKTVRTFEINFSYDLLMVGLRFWSNPSSSHGSSNFYGIRIFNSTNWNWMGNINSNCESTEDAYNDWHILSSPSSIDTELSSYSSKYCYTNVLIYFDPLFMQPGSQSKFNLEIIADIPSVEGWGFSHLVFNTFDDQDICSNGINSVIQFTTEYMDEDEIEYKYYGLKDVPSLYYGYAIFEISFYYRFHDISALISLSNNNFNNGNTKHWVIQFDDQESGIWIRAGIDEIPSNGVLTINEQLSELIVDRNSNNERKYTQMYIQWDKNIDYNYLRVGFGKELGSNIIATVKFDQLGIDSDYFIKYIGFARSLGSIIPDIDWKVYTNNLPSYCLSPAILEKTQEMNNYKQSCVSNNLMIYDLIKPLCIYHTPDVINYPLSYTFTIPEPHHFVIMEIKLFAFRNGIITVSTDTESADNEILKLDSVSWNNVNTCQSTRYTDGIAHKLLTDCDTVLESTFIHTSQHETFTISFSVSNIIKEIGISNIKL